MTTRPPSGARRAPDTAPSALTPSPASAQTPIDGTIGTDITRNSSAVVLRSTLGARATGAGAPPARDRDTETAQGLLNPTRNDLPETARIEIVALLQRVLVDAVDLHLLAKNQHWNVKGPRFFALHELFDRVAGEADRYADDLAERAVQLGGTPDGSAAAVAAGSTLPAVSARLESGSGHLRSMAGALAAFGRALRAAIDQTGRLGDAGSTDQLTTISRGVDKSLWLVEAHLQRS